MSCRRQKVELSAKPTSLVTVTPPRLGDHPSWAGVSAPTSLATPREQKGNYRLHEPAVFQLTDKLPWGVAANGKIYRWCCRQRMPTSKEISCGVADNGRIYLHCCGQRQNLPVVLLTVGEFNCGVADNGRLYLGCCRTRENLSALLPTMGEFTCGVAGNGKICLRCC